MSHSFLLFALESISLFFLFGLLFHHFETEVGEGARKLAVGRRHWTRGHRFSFIPEESLHTHTHTHTHRHRTRERAKEPRKKKKKYENKIKEKLGMLHGGPRPVRDVKKKGKKKKNNKRKKVKLFSNILYIDRNIHLRYCLTLFNTLTLDNFTQRGLREFLIYYHCTVGVRVRPHSPLPSCRRLCSRIKI